MASIRSGIVPTPEEFKSIQFQFGFMLKHGVMFPSEGSIIYQPSAGKITISVVIFEVGYVFLFPTSSIMTCRSMVFLFTI